MRFLDMSRNLNLLYGMSTAIMLLSIGTHGLGSADSRARGQNYYVSPDGSDRNNGSLKHPWIDDRARSIVVAAWRDRARTARVYRGRIVTAASGVADARITYISEQKWKAQIIGDDIDHSSWDNRGSYVDIIGFDVSGIGEPDFTTTALMYDSLPMTCTISLDRPRLSVPTVVQGSFTATTRAPITTRLAIASTISVGQTLPYAPPQAARCMASTMPTGEAIFSTISLPQPCLWHSPVACRI